jgi:predicted unusual protein kinase regulating ubiquinone biosynthesis (AarF/ABC1/UbiB family)
MTDIEILKMALKVTPYSKLMSSPIEEIKTRISEELDYYNEAKNTMFFYDNLNIDNVIIPEIHNNLSSKTVLTASRIEGLHLNEWLKTNPSSDMRTHYGQLICDLISESINRNMLIHADPNLGNFIFRDDGRLGLIDFGCVKKIETSFIENINFLSKSANEKDPEKLLEILDLAGIKYKKNAGNDALMLFSEWIEWITRPIRVDLFDFSKNQDYFTESGKFFPKIYSITEKYDGSMIYFGRTIHGIYRILHKLNAKVRFNFA